MAPDARPEIGAFRDVSNARFWLTAAVRHITNYFGFTSSTGNSNAEFPLLIEQRTLADGPRTAAFDPKPKSASEP